MKNILVVLGTLLLLLVLAYVFHINRVTREGMDRVKPQTPDWFRPPAQPTVPPTVPPRSAKPRETGWTRDENGTLVPDKGYELDPMRPGNVRLKAPEGYRWNDTGTDILEKKAFMPPPVDTPVNTVGGSTGRAIRPPDPDYIELQGPGQPIRPQDTGYTELQGPGPWTSGDQSIGETNRLLGTDF